MFIRDGIIATLHAQTMSNAEHLCQCMSLWGNELEASQLEQLPIGITEIDRVHKAAVNGTCVLNPKFTQALHHLSISGARDGEGKMMQVANILRCASPTRSGVQGWPLDPMLMQKVRQVPAVDAQELRRPGLHAIAGV